MLKFKGNYKNGYPNLICRMCKQAEETQTHVLEECPELHPDENTRVSKHHIFSDDTDTLRNIADEIEKISDTLSGAVY